MVQPPHAPVNSSPAPTPSVGRRRRVWIATASVGATLLLITACVLYADPAEVARRLKSVDVRWLLPALSLHVVQLSLLGRRWSRIAQMLGLSLNWGKATTEYAVSTLLNQLLPSGLAGDALRVLRHGRRLDQRTVGPALQAAALDRTSGQLGLWLLAIALLPLGSITQVLDGATLGLSLGGVGLLVLVMLQLAPADNPMVVRVRGFFVRAFRLLLSPRKAWAHLPISVVLAGLGVTQWYIASRAIGINLDWRRVIVLGPWLMVAASAPSLFGGWGIREGASGVIFAAAGLSVASGISVSVTYGLFGLIVSLPGVVVLVFDAGNTVTRDLVRESTLDHGFVTERTADDDQDARLHAGRQRDLSDTDR